MTFGLRTEWRVGNFQEWNGKKAFCAKVPACAKALRQNMSQCSWSRLAGGVVRSRDWGLTGAARYLRSIDVLPRCTHCWTQRSIHLCLPCFWEARRHATYFYKFRLQDDKSKSVQVVWAEAPYQTPLLSATSLPMDHLPPLERSHSIGSEVLCLGRALA